MKSVNKISSTENLLEMIRGNVKIDPPATAPTANGKGRGGPRGLISLQKGSNIGIYAGIDALRLTRMDVTGGVRRLEDFKTFPYPGNLTPKSDTFPAFLKTSLQKFGADSASRLWAVLPSDQVDVYQLRIPKSSGKDISGAIFWTMQKEKKFNENETVFDYTIFDEVMDKGIPKLQVACYLARKTTIQAVQRLYRLASFTLTGLTFEAAAINNLLRSDALAPNIESLAHVHIDQEWSQIDLFHHGNFIFNRKIKTGSNSLIEAIKENAAAVPRQPPPPEPGDSEEISLALKSAPAEPLTPEEAAALFQAHLAADAQAITATGGFATQDVVGMFTTALDRLDNQIERTFEYFVQTLNFSRVEKLLLSGPTALFPGLAGYMQEQLAMTVEVLDPFVSARMSGAAIHAPTSHAERILYAIPLGLAMADPDLTPNFLYTYREKELAKKNRSVTRAVAMTMMLLVALSLAVYGWQTGVRSDRLAELNHLQAELAAFNPDLNAEHLARLFADVRRNKDETGRSLVRHKAMAVLAEISAATASPNIQLHSIIFDAADRGASGRGNLILDGFVSGDRQMLNAFLSSYIVRLQDSGLLGNARLQKTSEELYPEIGNVLKFTLSVQYT